MRTIIVVALFLLRPDIGHPSCVMSFNCQYTIFYIGKQCCIFVVYGREEGGLCQILYNIETEEDDLVKRILALVLILMLCSSTAVALVVEPQEYNTAFAEKTGIYAYDAYVLCDSLTLRAKPDLNSKSLRSLSHGQKLLVSMREGEWYHVYVSEHVEGWVKSEYVLVNPPLYVTEAETPAYAYGSQYAPRVALISKNETLPIIHSTEGYYVVSLRGASAWIEKPEARMTKEFSLSQLLTITSAQLLVTDTATGTTKYHNEIKDSALLSEMGNLLADAEDRGGSVSGCPFGIAMLTLTFSDGSTALLDLAMDDCCIYRVNGRDYSYARSRWTPDTGATNDLLFSMFPGLMKALGRETAVQ